MNLVGANDVQRIQRTMKSAEHSEEFKLRSTCDPKPTSRDCAFAFGSVVFPLLFISCIHKIMKTRHTRIRKKRGRPATGQDPVVPVRLPPEIIKKIDHWGAKQPEPARSRSEAIRRLVETALAKAEAARTGCVKSAACGPNHRCHHRPRCGARRTRQAKASAAEGSEGISRSPR
jgi:hypothetical protein